MGGVEADVQPRRGDGRDQVGGRIAHVHRGDLQVRGLEVGVAFIQHPRLKRRQQADQDRHGIGCPVRVGHMPLDPLDPDADIDRAPATDLDHVAKALGAGRLADDTVVEDLALGPQGLDHPLGAVEGHALLVAGDQEGQGARHRPLGQGRGRRGGEGGDGALHVHGPAADQHAINNVGGEGLAAPGGHIAHRHHIGVAREAEVGPGGPDPGVKVLDLAKPHPAAGKAEARQDLLDHIHGPGVGRGHRRAPDQLPGQFDGVDPGHEPSPSEAR